MFEGRIGEVLINVITSWQVLVCTGVLILYLLLLNRVAGERKPGLASGGLRGRGGMQAKAKKAATALSGPKEAEDSEDSNSALGLEEEE